MLTSWEQKIVKVIAEGIRNRETTSALNLSTYTMYSHRGRFVEAERARSFPNQSLTANSTEDAEVRGRRNRIVHLHHFVLKGLI